MFNTLWPYFLANRGVMVQFTMRQRKPQAVNVLYVMAMLLGHPRGVLVQFTMRQGILKAVNIKYGMHLCQTPRSYDELMHFTAVLSDEERIHLSSLNDCCFDVK